MEDKQLLQEMKELKMNIQYESNSIDERDKETIVQDIIFYGRIEIVNPITKQEETKKIYMVEKNIDNKTSIEFYADNEVIATVIDEENQIVISPKYANVISAEIFLVKLQELRVQNKEQISLNKLEEIEEAREVETGKKMRTQENNKSKDKQEENQEKEDEEKETRKEENYNDDIEINMNAYITVDKRIADIIPEIKEKHCQKVMIRSNNNIDFEMYGIDKDGNEVELTTLKQKSGTNPYKEMIKTNIDGTEVESIKVSAMLQIVPGTNEKSGNEGIGIKIGNMGIEEVVYYRRDNSDKYLAVPVGLETTNDKYSEREVREIATKKYNPTIDDNIERAEERIQGGRRTTIENIDDNEHNNTRDEIEEELIRKAVKERCDGITLEEFIEIYEQEKGDTIQERIDNTVDTINNERYIEK